MYVSYRVYCHTIYHFLALYRAHKDVLKILAAVSWSWVYRWEEGRGSLFLCSLFFCRPASSQRTPEKLLFLTMAY